MRRFVWTLAAAAAVGATAVIALGAGSAFADPTLRIGLAEDPDQLDPTMARTFVGRIVFAGLCDKLLDITPDLQIVPMLATSYEWSEDGKALTLKLRQGVTFHDGEPFNAAAVKFNIERHLNMPGSNRKGEIGAISSVDVVDDMTVRINLSTVFAPLLAQLTDRAGMMISPKAAQAAGADFSRSPVCSGPFKFVERVPQDRIVLEKFQNYWNKDNIHFDKVIYLPIVDGSVRLANLQSGGIDVIERMLPHDVTTVQGDKRLKTASIVELGYQGITINTFNGPKAQGALGGPDPRVREAFELSIDRDALNQVVYEDQFVPGNQWVPPQSPYYVKSLPVPKRDVARAKQLLKEAGKPNPVVDFMVPNDTERLQLAQVIQAMAAEAGFDLRIRATEFATSLDLGERGDFEAYLLAWSGRLDPDGNLFIALGCKGPFNYGKYCKPEVDSEIMAGRSVLAPEERMKHYTAVAQAALRDRPVIYLFHRRWLYGYTAKLDGFQPYPDGLIRLVGMRLQ